MRLRRQRPGRGGIAAGGQGWERAAGCRRAALPRARGGRRAAGRSLLSPESAAPRIRVRRSLDDGWKSTFHVLFWHPPRSLRVSLLMWWDFIYRCLFPMGEDLPPISRSPLTPLFCVVFLLVYVSGELQVTRMKRFEFSV